MKRALIAVIFSAFAFQANAQGLVDCAEAAAHLRDKYGETEMLRGAVNDGSLMRFFGNADTGTWTLVRELPGLGCAPAGSGEGLTVVKPRAPEQAS